MHKRKKKNFLLEVEKKSGKSAPEIYGPMGWSRARYSNHRVKGTFNTNEPSLESLRKAANLTNTVFYTLVKEILGQ